MFRWTYFTHWQGEAFPAHLRKTDRLPQAESLGAACFPRPACVPVSLYLCQVSTKPHGANMPCSDGAVADTRPLNSAAESSAGACDPSGDGSRMRDTPYGRCRTLTAAYRAGACLSLDGCRAVPSQRLFSKLLFLICAKATSARFSFPAVSRRWQVPRQNSKQKRRKNLPAVSASYDPSCVCSIVQFLMAAPFFGRTHFDILLVLNQSEKLLAVAFHPCLLCSDLNA